MKITKSYLKQVIREEIEKMDERKLEEISLKNLARSAIASAALAAAPVSAGAVDNQSPQAQQQSQKGDGDRAYAALLSAYHPAEAAKIRSLQSQLVLMQKSKDVDQNEKQRISGFLTKADEDITIDNIRRGKVNVYQYFQSFR
jgi:hypothetical protein